MVSAILMESDMLLSDELLAMIIDKVSFWNPISLSVMYQ